MMSCTNSRFTSHYITLLWQTEERRTDAIDSLLDVERDVALRLRNAVVTVEQRVHAEPRQRATHLEHVVLHAVSP